MKTKILFLLVLSVFLSSVPTVSFADPPSSKNNYFKKMVVGTWILEDSSSYGEMIVAKDGNIVGKGYVKKNDKTAEYKFKSTWEIVNGMWVEKTIESTIPSMVGDSSIDKIVFIDLDKFILLTQKGETLSLRRKH